MTVHIFSPHPDDDVISIIPPRDKDTSIRKSNI